MDTLLIDDLWGAIAPHLPPIPAARTGRPRIPDYDCFRGILYVLREGVRWQSLPTALGWGSGSTCWRRFRAWALAGAWGHAHVELLKALHARGLLDLGRVVVDSASCRAHAGGAHTGPNPTDRGKKGCKRHVLTDACGIPLLVGVGPANRRDETALPALLWLLWVLLGCLGGRRRPGARQADRGYGFPWTIAVVLGWGIRARIAARGSAHGSGLGRTRLVVERTHARFGQFRRLAQCYERDGRHFLGMQQLAACVICARKLRAGRQPAEEFQPFEQAA